MINNVYVYYICQGQQMNLTYVIQTEKFPNEIVEGETFKDVNGICWVYEGEFESSYIAPPSAIIVNYDGNFFSTGFQTIYEDCETCIITPICYEYWFENITTEIGHSTLIKPNLLTTCPDKTFNNVPIPVGDGVCLFSTTNLIDTNGTQFIPEWEDGFLPLPRLGVDYTLTLNGCK